MKNKTKPDRKGAFTLVEMLVVMFIISLLAAILFPVVFRAWERAAKRQAQAEAGGLVMAIKAYRSLFGKWPAQTNTSNVCYFTNNYMVITKLMGHNPRKRSFININTNSLDSKSNYLDPDGVPYVIFIIQSGSRFQKVTMTNSYSNERTELTKSFILKITNSAIVGAGAFMDITDLLIVSSLTVNSWSDF